MFCSVVPDRIPNRGKIRLSYLAVSSALSFLPWIALAHTAPSRASFVYLAVLLTTQHIGAAMVDVVVDVSVAEAVRDRYGLLLFQILPLQLNVLILFGAPIHAF